MKTRIVRIGNSRGIRIPKPLLEEAGLENEVDLSVRDDSIVITPARAPRAGWDDTFADMARRGDDAPADPDSPVSTRFDEEEWEW